DWASVKPGLQVGRSAVVTMHEWGVDDGLNTRLAAPISDFALPAHYPRKKIRAMGRVSEMSTVASELALEQAKLLNEPVLSDGRTGIAYGSSTGSTAPI
ncbi:beta-ketoacyl-ACP synthase, partial [Aeromonas hydrophila]